MKIKIGTLVAAADCTDDTVFKICTILEEDKMFVAENTDKYADCPSHILVHQDIAMSLYYESVGFDGAWDIFELKVV